jgi:Uma2 family endonuclease
MGSPAKKGDHKYTYTDYRAWPDEERWEIMDGEAYAMTPAPSVSHQLVAGNVFGIFRDYFKVKSCQPFIAPTDVVFDETNIVQPDVFVVCDKSKITKANIQGAPDLIVEILSGATKLKDRREKKALYERFGVKEYLIVHPEDETVDRYRLTEGRFEGPDVFGWHEMVRLHAFPDLELQLWEVFGRELPKEESSEEEKP